MDHSTPRRDLYGDAQGRWAILTHSGDGTAPPYVELDTAGPHIPLPGPVHRLVALGTLSDAALLADDAGAPGWAEDVAARFVAVRDTREPDLHRYLRRHSERMRQIHVLSVGGWIAGLDHVAFRDRFPDTAPGVIRTTLAAIYAEGAR